MQIKNLYLHNFANIPDGSYTFGELTLITGGNGSGKTSMADAIQTVMTAAREGWYRYNAGQEEASSHDKKKSKRTLESYILGCDEVPYSRPYTCDSYIGINWEPTPGEKSKPFSSMIGARATLSQEGEKRAERLQNMTMYIIPGRNVDLNDLKTKDGSRWLDMENELLPALRSKFGGKAGVEVYDAKEKYLCRLYAMFLASSARLPKLETKQMVKSWTKFMAYQQVKDLGKFVRESVLEPKDNSGLIQEVRSLMREIARMTADAQHIDEGISILAGGLAKAEGYFKHHLEHYRILAVLRRSEFVSHQAEYVSKKNEQRQFLEEIDQLEGEVEAVQLEHKSLFSELASIHGQLKGHSQYARKEDLQTQADQAGKDLAFAGAHLAGASDRANRAKDALLALLNIIDNRSDSRWVAHVSPLRQELSSALNAIEHLDNVVALVTDADITAKELQAPMSSSAQADRAIAEVCDRLGEVTEEGSIRAILANSHLELRDEVKKAEGRVTQLEREIAKLEQDSKVTHPPEVVKTLDALKRQYPECNPRVVGDHIDIKDAAWQQAIEGYMGGARNYILVDAKYEAKAIELVRDKKFGSKVVQGEKARADAKRVELPSDSIVSLMEFADEGVRSYVIASYGQVRQAADAEALRHIGRGVTRDGMGSGGYAMFYCLIRERDLMCGKGAIERRIQALEIDLLNARTSFRTASDQSQEVRQLSSNLNSLEPLGLSDALSKAISSIELRDSALREIELLDLSDIENLEELRDEVSAQLETVNNRLQKAKDGIAKRNTRLYGVHGTKSEPESSSLTHIIKRMGAKTEEFEEKAELALDDYTRYLSDEVEVEADDLYHRINELAAQTDLEGQKQLHLDIKKTQSADTAVRGLHEAIGNYNSNPIQGETIQNTVAVLGDSDAIAFTETLYKAVKDTRGQLEAKHHSLKNNVLVQRRDTLEATQSKFEDTFTQQIVQVILEQSRQSLKTLRAINRELTGHRFDDETFEFTYSKNKEYKRYLDCFEELETLGATTTRSEESLLFGSGVSEKSSEVIHEIRDLLLQDDTAKADRALALIGDYRNYYEYDILKKPEGKESIRLSTYGRGSGGQNETPFYVIMCAAFQSSLRFHDGSSHLRTICIDESFTRLDENRTRRILSYLCEKVGLQVIFVSPPSKSGVYKDLLTNEVVMERVHDDNPPPRSELETRVVVDQQVTNPDRIAEMFETHREGVKRQTQMSFMDMLAAEESGN